jgi:hypothetical protein
LSFFVLEGLAVTWIFPLVTCALNEWMADGAGASSVVISLNYQDYISRSCRPTNITGANIETGYDQTNVS